VTRDPTPQSDVETSIWRSSSGCGT
jgi:hypothetical protein